MEFEINGTSIINKKENGQIVANNNYGNVFTEENLSLITGFSDEIYSEMTTMRWWAFFEMLWWKQKIESFEDAENRIIKAYKNSLNPKLITKESDRWYTINIWNKEFYLKRLRTCCNWAVMQHLWTFIAWEAWYPIIQPILSVYNWDTSYLLQEYEKYLKPIDEYTQSDELAKIEKDVNEFMQKDSNMKKLFNWWETRDYEWKNSFMKDGRLHLFDILLRWSQFNI